MSFRAAPQTHASKRGYYSGDGSRNGTDYCDEGGAIFVFIVIILIVVGVVGRRGGGFSGDGIVDVDRRLGLGVCGRWGGDEGLQAGRAGCSAAPVGVIVAAPREGDAYAVWSFGRTVSRGGLSVSSRV
jgi:hypothetical protein